MAKDPRIDTGSRSRQLPPEAHIRMHFERFSSFVEEYSSKLSLSGMFVATRDPRPVGSEVAFDLKLADGFRLFHGHGQVAWVRLQEGGANEQVGMALRFVALDEKGRELVLKVLEEQLKAGGLPFEIDPPPPGAVLDFDGLADEAAPAGAAAAGPGQLQIPLADDFAEEPTLVTTKRRALDETGFDAPWGQKLPEVPTDLLDENEGTPAIPSVSEVVFASRPAAPALPAAAPAASQTGLFAAAFPSGSSRVESPEGLGFVLDENLPAEEASAAETSFSPDSAFATFEAPEEELSWDLGESADSAGFALEAPAAGEIPYEPDPEDFSFDSEEPTLIGTASVEIGEEPTVIGSRASVLPAEGFFSVGPGEKPLATDAPPAPTFAAAPEPSYPAPPAPTYAPPPAPSFAAPAAQPSLFDSWESPTPEPAPVVAPPALEAFTPFDLGRSSAASPTAENDERPRTGYTGLGVQRPPAVDTAFALEAEQWPEEDDYLEEAPSRGARFKEALRSRRAVLGLVATAVLVTAAYFLAGDLLGPGKTEPPARLQKTGTRPPERTTRPVAPSTAGGEAPQPVPGPEQIVAQPDATAAAEPEAGVAPSAIADGGGFEPQPSLGAPEPTRAEPTRAEPTRAEPTRAEPRQAPGEPARLSSARWLVKVEVHKGAGQTIVELIFDGEMDRTLFEHNPMAYDKGKDQLAFSGIEGSRSANREVGSPELTRIRMGAHPGELRVVFDHPAGIRISSIDPQGERVRVVFER